MNDIVWPTLPQCHVQGIEHQLCAQMIGHRPAHHPPRAHVENDREKQKTRPGRQWSKKQGVVGLFPCFSSPNRTCAFQRIRLSIQERLKAMATSRYFPSCQLVLHFTDYQRSSPLYGQLIDRTSLSNCSPSPCDRLSRSLTTTRAPPVHRSSGPHSLGISMDLPQFTCRTQIHW